MTKCKYFDSGWCYAPKDVSTSAQPSGACAAPTFCPYLISQQPVQYETPMTEIEDLKAQIKVLEKKLALLEEMEKHKSPAEEAYKNTYGFYPEGRGNGLWTVADDYNWQGFQAGYDAAQKDYNVGEYQETAQDQEELMEKLGFVKNSDGNWTAQPLVETAEEQTKDKVPLYNRFRNEGSYGCIGFDSALEVVKDFLIVEGEIEYEDKEYVTITLQKSLLDDPNDNLPYFVGN